MRQQVEGVHRLRQIGEEVGSVFAHPPGFHARLGSPKPVGERTMFFRVAQRAQQLAHPVRAAARGTDDTQRGRQVEASRPHIFEDLTLERAALRRSIAVNAATAIDTKGAAGLQKVQHR